MGGGTLPFIAVVSDDSIAAVDVFGRLNGPTDWFGERTIAIATDQFAPFGLALAAS